MTRSSSSGSPRSPRPAGARQRGLGDGRAGQGSAPGPDGRPGERRGRAEDAARSRALPRAPGPYLHHAGPRSATAAALAGGAVARETLPATVPPASSERATWFRQTRPVPSALPAPPRDSRHGGSRASWPRGTGGDGTGTGPGAIDRRQSRKGPGVRSGAPWRLGVVRVAVPGRAGPGGLREFPCPSIQGRPGVTAAPTEWPWYRTHTP